MSETKETKEIALDKQLSNLYYAAGDPGSYGGVERLFQRAKDLNIGGKELTRRRVAAFLKAQQAYTLHRPARRHFPRNRTYVAHTDQQWQADLVDIQPLAEHNDGNRYLLTCIDILSKFVWVVPTKSKDAAHMVGALRTLLKTAHPRKPERLQTDKGKEFFNSSVAALLREHNIHHFASQSDQKAAVVERFNRTLKTRMWAYFSAKHTKRYMDVLPDLVDAYNHSVHRMIGMRPVDVHGDVRNEKLAWRRLYYTADAKAKRNDQKAKILAPGTLVRVHRWKGDFEKGYMPNWMREHFVVREAPPEGAAPRAVYKLQDAAGEPVEGVWYREELQPIERNIYEVDEVLGERRAAGKRGNPKEVLVKWLGLPAKFNRWIPKRDLPKHQRTTAQQWQQHVD